MLSLSSCHGTINPASTSGSEDISVSSVTVLETGQPVYSGEIIDLTQMSSTVVYSQVYCMTVSPDEYKGISVRMTGLYNFYHDPESGNDYHAGIILDATACCAQGIEFELTEDYAFPDDYPKQGDTITVSGMFDTYEEDGTVFSILRNAKLE